MGDDDVKKIDEADGEDETQASGSNKNQKKNFARRMKAKIKKTTSGDKESKASKEPSASSDMSAADVAAQQKEFEKMINRMKLTQMIGGSDNKRKKTMSEHKFWSTQPVVAHDQRISESGPIEPNPPVEKLRKEHLSLPKDFEWVLVDVDDAKQVEELHELLSNHYVEDDDESFRFNYTVPFMKWALKAPGFTKDYHIGVRVSSSKKLVAFISGIPVNLRVRDQIVHQVEINFLCVHKKLRNKRLAPVLIKEVTRRCNLNGIFQALYTAGAVLPKPVSTCRYYHRSLNPKKLVEIGFSRVPKNLTMSGLIKLNRLPPEPEIQNVREMKDEDAPKVGKLLAKYLEKFDLAPIMTDEEVQHWFCSGDHRLGADKQVVWSYVVENPETKEITDFFSFYSLPSSVLGNKQHTNLNAAYCFYYATDVAWDKDGKHLTDLSKDSPLTIRLNEISRELSIAAAKAKFDVLNALTLMDNTLFLEQQKFGAGDGFLNYYLFNWKCPAIRGGIKSMPSTPSSQAIAPLLADEPTGTEGGVAVVML